MEKIFISADIEGTCGVADWRETDPVDPQSAYFRAQMSREVQAACAGAVAAGAREILVKDAHDDGRNIDPRVLPECARIMRSWTGSPYSMMAGLDDSFDAALLIGYHSGAASDGNPLSHTMNLRNVRVLLNGAEASEFLLNAHTAASFGVPVVLVSGDRALCESVAGYHAAIRTVAVSEGIGGAAVSIHPDLAVARIREAAAEAVRVPRPALPPRPDRFELEVQFRNHERAYRGSFYPGAVRHGTLGLAFACTEWLDALRFLYFVL